MTSIETIVCHSLIGKTVGSRIMPGTIDDSAEHLDNFDVTTAAEKCFLIRNEEHKMKLEEKRLDDTMKAREHERELKTSDIRIREMTQETERMKLQFEENSKAREHELILKREVAEIMRLTLERDKPGTREAETGKSTVATRR